MSNRIEVVITLLDLVTHFHSFSAVWRVGCLLSSLLEGKLEHVFGLSLQPWPFSFQIHKGLWNLWISSKRMRCSCILEYYMLFGIPWMSSSAAWDCLGSLIHRQISTHRWTCFGIGPAFWVQYCLCHYYVCVVISSDCPAHHHSHALAYCSTFLFLSHTVLTLSCPFGYSYIK